MYSLQEARIQDEWAAQIGSRESDIFSHNRESAEVIQGEIDLATLGVWW